MLSQRELVERSLHATAAHDLGGIRHRHETEVDRLRAENAVLRQARAVLAEEVLRLRTAAERRASEREDHCEEGSA